MLVTSLDHAQSWTYYRPNLCFGYNRSLGSLEELLEILRILSEIFNHSLGSYFLVESFITLAAVDVSLYTMLLWRILISSLLFISLLYQLVCPSRPSPNKKKRRKRKLCAPRISIDHAD